MKKTRNLGPLQPLTPLDPGVRTHDGKSKISHVNRFGMQSDKNDGYYICEWNPKTGKHEKIWIEEKQEN